MHYLRTHTNKNYTRYNILMLVFFIYTQNVTSKQQLMYAKFKKLLKLSD